VQPGPLGAGALATRHLDTGDLEQHSKYPGKAASTPSRDTPGPLAIDDLGFTSRL
jgi:hypothetical protein